MPLNSESSLGPHWQWAVLCWITLTLRTLNGETLTSFTDPPNGTIISAEVGTSASNITLRCDINATGADNTSSQVQTSWWMENYRDENGFVRIETVKMQNNDTILIHGRNKDEFPFTYRNLLTFLRFVPEFDGAVLSCARADTSLNIGRFPLVAYRPPTHPHGLIVETVEDTWLEISWLHPLNLGQPEMSSHSIQLLESHTQREETHTIGATNSTFTFSGLLPGTDYTITVAGVTDLTATTKVSNYSSTAITATLQAADVQPLQFSMEIPVECQEWVENNVAEKLEELTTDIAIQIKHFCSCRYRQDYIQESYLSCPFPRRAVATFNARVVGVPAANTTVIAHHVVQTRHDTSILPTPPPHNWTPGSAMDNSPGNTTLLGIATETGNTTTLLVIAVGSVLGTLAVVIPMLLFVAGMSARYCRKRSRKKRTLRINSFRRKSDREGDPIYANTPCGEHSQPPNAGQCLFYANISSSQPLNEDECPLYANTPTGKVCRPIDAGDQQSHVYANTTTERHLDTDIEGQLQCSPIKHEIKIAEPLNTDIFDSVNNTPGSHLPAPDDFSDHDLSVRTPTDSPTNEQNNANPDHIYATVNKKLKKVKGDPETVATTSHLKQQESASSVELEHAEEELLMTLLELETLTKFEEPPPHGTESPRDRGISGRYISIQPDWRSPNRNRALPALPGEPEESAGERETDELEIGKGSRKNTPPSLLSHTFLGEEKCALSDIISAIRTCKGKLEDESSYKLSNLQLHSESETSLIEERSLPENKSFLPARSYSVSGERSLPERSEGLSKGRSTLGDTFPLPPRSSRASREHMSERTTGEREVRRYGSPLSQRSYTMSGGIGRTSSPLCLPRVTSEGMVYHQQRRATEGYVHEISPSDDTYEVPPTLDHLELPQEWRRRGTMGTQQTFPHSGGEQAASCSSDVYEVLTTPTTLTLPSRPLPQAQLSTSSPNLEDIYEELTTPTRNEMSDTGGLRPEALQSADSYEILTTPKAVMKRTAFDTRGLSPAALQSADSYEVLTNPKAATKRTAFGAWGNEHSDNFSIHSPQDSYEVLTNPKATTNSAISGQEYSDDFSIHSPNGNADSYEVMTTPEAGEPKWLKEAVKRIEDGQQDDDFDAYEVLTTPKQNRRWASTSGSSLPPKPHPLGIKTRALAGIEGLKDVGLPNHLETQHDTYASIDQANVMYAELQLPATTGKSRERSAKPSTKLWKMGGTAHSSPSLEKAPSLSSFFRKKNQKDVFKEEDEYMPMASLAAQWRAKPVRRDRQVGRPVPQPPEEEML